MWIDGDISSDAAGNLYVTRDTQTSAGDIGWLTYSADGGRISLTWGSAAGTSRLSAIYASVVKV